MYFPAEGSRVNFSDGSNSTPRRFLFFLSSRGHKFPVAVPPSPPTSDSYCERMANAIEFRGIRGFAASSAKVFREPGTTSGNHGGTRRPSRDERAYSSFRRWNPQRILHSSDVHSFTSWTVSLHGDSQRIPRIRASFDEGLP